MNNISSSSSISSINISSSNSSSSSSSSSNCCSTNSSGSIIRYSFRILSRTKNSCRIQVKIGSTVL